MSIRRLHKHPERISDAHAVLDEAVAMGARGVLLVVLHDDGTIEPVTCGDVTIADLSITAHVLAWTVGEALKGED